MRRLMIVAAAAVSMTAAMTGGNAWAAAMPNAAVATAASEAVPLQQAQYVWGGRNYCWYGNGWQGPGWYWCGYPWRRGYGWGGGYGWNGWGGHGGGWHGGGGHGWHGGGGHGWHGGGWHGGGGHGGARMGAAGSVAAADIADNRKTRASTSQCQIERLCENSGLRT